MLICSKKILCTKATIWDHVRKSNHKLKTLQDYGDKTTAMYENKRKNDMKMADLIAKSNISDTIGNLCNTIYNQKCNTIYNSRKGIYEHFKHNSHSCMYKGGLNNCLSKVTAHKCTICWKLILCDLEIFLKHLQGCHNISTIMDYCNITGTKIEYRNAVKKQNIDLFLSNHRKQSEISEKLDNLCIFACKKCNFTCGNWRWMTNHIREKTHGPKLPYIKHVTKAVFHKCKQCSELILCDCQILSNHLRLKHKMNITTYKKLASIKNDELLTEFKLKLRTMVQNIPHHTHILKFTLQPNALPDNQVTKHVGNISIFRCLFCKVSDLSYHSLMKHNRMKHKLQKLPLITRTIEAARSPRCYNCSAILICDNVIGQNSVKNKHKMKFSDYCKNYVSKNGGKVFPTFNEYKANINVFETFSTDSKLTDKKTEPDDSDLILPSMISSESEASDEET